jgi:DNA-binding transcriptional regulator YiaG
VNRIGALHCKRPTAEAWAAREAEGRDLRAWRERAGLSRREVSEKLAINVIVLRRWEDGETPIPQARREQLRTLGWAPASEAA